uniref:Carboxylesterase type B domain-containing protein n=1 Tax=Plectus sambesii TaxID=2011161 RepID=A0A914XL27_9BILA
MTGTSVCRSLAILLLINAVTSENDSILRDTKQGRIEGETEVIDGQQIAIFRGIPYAQAPVRGLRFKNPAELEKRDKLLTTRKWPPSCVKFNRSPLSASTPWNKAIESEDCLYLSIISKIEDNNELQKPLLAIFTNENVNLHEIIRHIVLKNVTAAIVQFRTGPLGYFSTGNDVAEGNWGLKDIEKALTWLNDNHQYFDYSPENITVMAQNEEAAALSLAAQLSSSRAGLFQRAILLNGNSHSPHFSPDESVVGFSKKLADTVECDIPSQTQMVDCMRAIELEELGAALNKIIVDETHGILFRPTPSEHLEEGKDVFARIIGAQYTLPTDIAHEFNENYTYASFKKFLSNLISAKDYKNAALIRRLVLHNYIHSQGDKKDNKFLWKQSRQMLIDLRFIAPAELELRTPDGERPESWLFSYSINKPISSCLNKKSAELSEFCNLLFNFTTIFAKVGKPSTCKDSNPTWPQLKSIKYCYGKVQDNRFDLSADFYQSAVSFWNDLVPMIQQLEVPGRKETDVSEDEENELDEDDVQLWHQRTESEIIDGEKLLTDMPFRQEL